jgi:hypothetical protein
MLNLRFSRPGNRAVFGLVFVSLAHSALSSSHGFLAGIQQRDSTKPQLQQISQHVSAGEFPRAMELIEELPADQQDDARAVLFRQQLKSGATRGAANTAMGFNDDQVRISELSRLKRQYGSVGSDLPSSGTGKPGNWPGADISGSRGGITENDYQPLIDLITGTISPDRWQDQDGPNSIRPYVSGVYVDHNATLQRLKVDPSRFSRLLEKGSTTSNSSQNWFEDSGNRDAHWKTDLRKVSLNRLERAAELQFALGLPFDDAILNLAGLTEVQYVFVDREQGEIVIAGPAGPWKYDSIGRPVNAENGKPLLQLEDFVVLLRNAFYDSGKFGCSIDPRAKNLAAVQELIHKNKFSGPWKKKLRDAMGQQDIVVFGIDPQTHLARVLVEADHHMKLVGMGLEPSIPEVPSYLDRLSLNAQSPTLPNDVVRWWFTSKETDLTCDETLECFELTGCGVQVLSESELLGRGGTRIQTGRATGPTAGFAQDFSKHFLKMANRYPIYHELQNAFSLALVANLIKHQNLDQRSQRGLDFFKGSSNRTSVGLCFPIRLAPAPIQVDTVMNERVFQYRKANSTVRTPVIAVSGGVEFDACSVLAEQRLKTVDQPAMQSVKHIGQVERQVWWWD